MRRGIEAEGATTLGEYYRWRLDVHLCDSYFGVPLFKFPEDLRTYEHLLHASRANVVIEIGVAFGGSALWFRDRLETLARHGRLAGPVRVIGMDIDIGSARSFLTWADSSYAGTINLLEGDIRDPGSVARIEELIPPGSRVFVVEDSAHTYETTRAALDGLSHLLGVGGWFVVEDGNRDYTSLSPVTAAGDDRPVVDAVVDWLGTPQGADYVLRRDVEMYHVTSNPCGYLQRVGAGMRRAGDDPETAGFLQATRRQRFERAYRDVVRAASSADDVEQLTKRWMASEFPHNAPERWTPADPAESAHWTG